MPCVYSAMCKRNALVLKRQFVHMRKHTCGIPRGRGGAVLVSSQHGDPPVVSGGSKCGGRPQWHVAPNMHALEAREADATARGSPPIDRPTRTLARSPSTVMPTRSTRGSSAELTAADRAPVPPSTSAAAGALGAARAPERMRGARRGGGNEAVRLCVTDARRVPGPVRPEEQEGSARNRK